ncbi:D-methionine transport system substrate-binding protein [Alkalihalobacillus xiaoxiensis]|uniref:Lipoprotein n=1 Tax=Shouchella xiaoxiensis TaxID=766895 RepID=A0ABS2SYC1_9BACI|nr:D-methionine transport system substrate-binding protein [Shouchella xiaoxiensis]
MMKTFLRTIGVVGVSFALVACGTADEEENNSTGGDGEGEGEEELTTVSISASNVPHAEILEFASSQLAEEGIELDIHIANDYIFPNVGLDSNEFDANYFQHRPYLESQIAENGFDFTEAGAIHLEPMGLYSQEHDSIDAIPDGATVLMSNSVADHGRVYSLLHEAGLITLEEGPGVDVTEQDISENPKNLTFQTSGVDAELLPTAYEQNQADIIAINSNYAIGAGLSPLEDSLYIEEGDENNPYVNLIVVRTGDEDRPEIQTLVDVLQSEEVQSFIEDEYAGAVVPVQ